ncbi:hypothetical protein B9N43_07335 [Denitratisoma sp. DHT3]|uniref:GNVR domain-containing protein n=1 Tax=Denitratisoma sp. DHT3 TaxID=1981880 RepID=UPI00119884BB|nr:GNVR domain-containing protein [Denitratisoma sp. DHT3]QDX81072.1 hypothetical protein B9N43_07335 [Denitratisoma sp. DHT3]
MNTDLLFAALRARYRVFLLVVAATVLAATVVSLVMPKTYVATASILVDGRDEQSMANRSAPLERERIGYLQTQVDILTGMQVARQVVADLRLGDDAELREKFESDTGAAGGTGDMGSFEEWLGQALRKEVKVDTTQSSVIRLSFPARQPKFAAAVANGFAKAYVDAMLKLRTEPTRVASVWFDEQAVGLRADLERARQRLAEYQRQKGIVVSDERFDVENARFVELANQVARAGNRHADALAGNLAQAEARLREMAVEFGPRHPQYLQQQALVDELRTNLMDRAQNDGAASYGRQRRAGLVAAMEAQRERVLQLKIARGELAVLEHDVALAQQTYDQAMQRLMANRIDSRASQTNVSIIDPAVPPGKPSRPRILLNIGLSLALGIMLALTVVYLMETADRRVRRAVDLEGDPEVPMLAVLNRWEPLERGLPGPRLARHLLR